MGAIRDRKRLGIKFCSYRTTLLEKDRVEERKGMGLDMG